MQRIDSSSTIMTTTMKTIKEGDILIYHIEPNDVLLGKGSPIVNHKGNQTLIKLVQSRKEEYRETSLNGVKDQIAHEIVNTIISKNGGRFLRKVEDSSEEPKSLGISLMDKESAVWVIVDEYDALQKVKQALRERGRSKVSIQKTNKNYKDGVAVKCQKTSFDIIDPKEDESLSIETPFTDVVTLPSLNVTYEQQELHQYDGTKNSTNRLTYKDLLLTSAQQQSNVSNGRQQELHHHDNTNISNNRLTDDDLLLSSARLQLKKRIYMNELLIKRQFEINNAVHKVLTTFHRTNHMMVANNNCYDRVAINSRPAVASILQMNPDNNLMKILRQQSQNNHMLIDNECSHHVNNYSRPTVAACTTKMVQDNALLKMLRLQNHDTKMISEMVKKKQMDNISSNNVLNTNDLLLYGLQRNQAIDTTSSLVNDKNSLLSNSSYFVSQQQQQMDVAFATNNTTDNTRLSTMMMNNRNNDISMELLLLKKKREMCSNILLASESFTTKKRLKTDPFENDL